MTEQEKKEIIIIDYPSMHVAKSIVTPEMIEELQRILAIEYPSNEYKIILEAPYEVPNVYPEPVNDFDKMMKRKEQKAFRKMCKRGK